MSKIFFVLGKSCSGKDTIFQSLKENKQLKDELKSKPDAQITLQDDKGNKYFAHTLNNTCVAPPRMLIAFLENNLQEDGSVLIPEALQPYMGGTKKIG